MAEREQYRAERSAPGCVASYPPIDSYAFLADGQSAALIGPDRSVEWLCAPRFDGASVFARLLDRERGGAFELTVEDAPPSERRYLDGTLVLESRFESETASIVLLDFMALEAEGRHGARRGGSVLRAGATGALRVGRGAGTRPHRCAS